MLSVMMPCYKEAENLKIIIPSIKEVLLKTEPDSEILIVDTMESMDETKEICENYSKVSDGVIVRYIPRRGGNNYGDAIRTGIADSKGEYLIIMDADGSHDVKDIARLYDEIKRRKCGVVIGSRYMKGGYTDNPFILKLMSYMLNVTYRILFHINVKDVSDSYRIYEAQKLKSIELECDNFDIVEEILITLKQKYKNIEFKEIPISFNKRAYGESKRDLMKFIASYIETIRRLKRIQLRRVDK